MNVELVSRNDVPVWLRLGERLHRHDVESDLHWLFGADLWKRGTIYTSTVAQRFVVRASIGHPDVVVGINAYRDYVQPDIQGQLRATACIPSVAPAPIQQAHLSDSNTSVKLRNGSIFRSLEGYAVTYPARLEAVSQELATLSGVDIGDTRVWVAGHYGLHSPHLPNILEVLDVVWQEAMQQETAVQAAQFAMKYTPIICWPEDHE